MLEIKYCPMCMQELERQGYSNFYCKLCKVVFYIIQEYKKVNNVSKD